LVYNYSQGVEKNICPTVINGYIIIILLWVVTLTKSIVIKVNVRNLLSSGQVKTSGIVGKRFVTLYSVDELVGVLFPRLFLHFLYPFVSKDSEKS